MSTPGMGDKAEGDQGLKSRPSMGLLYVDNCIGAMASSEALNHGLLATIDFF